VTPRSGELPPELTTALTKRNRLTGSEEVSPCPAVEMTCGRVHR